MASRRRKTQSKPQEFDAEASHSAPTLAPSQLRKFVKRTLLLLALILAAYSILSRSSTHEKPVGALTDDETRDANIFSVQDIPGKGKGVIAIRDIKQGELVIRERPLFIVPTQVSASPTAVISQRLRHLDSKDYERFFNLSYVHFPAGLDPEVHIDELALAIFQTNAVAAGGQGVGIFPRMARLNHGCSSAFNVVYSWREREGALVVHALKDIRKGQELLTTYTNTKRPRDERSLPEQQLKASDQRLILISELYERFATWGRHSISGVQAIDIVRRIWDLGSEEGYLSERGQLAADAAWVAAAHLDANSVREWAKLAAKWYSYELGGESEQVSQMNELAAHPESHTAWASRERMEVGTLR